jgi:hypothetical protein
MISLRSFDPAYRFRRFMDWSRRHCPGLIESVADTAGPGEVAEASLRAALSLGCDDEDIDAAVPKFERGARLQRDRLAAVAAWCAEAVPGDIAEIGAYVGLTTVRLAEIARRFGRRVLVIDPWLPGTQNCSGGEYDAFLANTADFRDIVDVVRESSLSEAAKGALRGRKLCFALVDGLHTYDACLSDILAVDHCGGAIAVDDLGVMVVRDGDAGATVDLGGQGGSLYDEALRTAFRRAARLTGRQAVHHARAREGYLLVRP